MAKQTKEPKYNAQELGLIKARCAPNADAASFDHMIYLATLYDLDPLLKEIWCVTDNKGNHRIQVARDGFLKIANSHEAFDGIHADTICEGDFYAVMPDGGLDHRYAAQRGPLVGAYCRVWRKDRTHPSYFFAPYKEYAAGSPIWRQYPSSMIIKVAEAMALKRAFSLSGLTSAEEMDASATPDIHYGQQAPAVHRQMPQQAAPAPQQVAPLPPAPEPGPTMQAAPQEVPQQAPPQQGLTLTRQQQDAANFMAGGQAEPQAAPPAKLMTNKQRATVIDLLANPALPEPTKVASQKYFDDPTLTEAQAQGGINRLLDIIYPKAA